jgi:hypothetical protein
VQSSKTWRFGLTAAVWAAAAAVAMAAEPGGFRAPSLGDRLRPNEPSTVSWSLEPGALAERDEMELVLSLDGGATFPIRVTGKLSTSTRTLDWRVPSLPTARAVLALRAGNEEDDERETLLAVSEPFTIAADTNAVLEPLYPVAGEWRTGDALDGAPVRKPSHDLASTDGGPELFSVDGDGNESETPPVGFVEARLSESGAVANAPPLPHPVTPLRLTTSLPLPLRL